MFIGLQFLFHCADRRKIFKYSKAQFLDSKFVNVEGLGEQYNCGIQRNLFAAK